MKGVNLPDFSGLRVHVIGDAIRDVYTQAKCLGAASKSPTLVYEKGESQEWIGGAGVVAAHCRAAGAEVQLTTAGETVKERIIVEGVKVAEFHTRHEDRPQLIIDRDDWQQEEVDAVIYADFQHGMFNHELTPVWNKWAPNALRAADSQTTDISWGNILDFSGCDLLFANEREARFALRDQETKDIGPALWSESAAKAVFLKLGSRGLDIHSADGARHISAFARLPIVDPIGAGDALLAYATLTYAVTKDLEQAGIIGSLAAAEACAHMGNVPVTLEAVKARAGALA
jgi:sugar/nucleoside kinase (ribokinase family)